MFQEGFDTNVRFHNKKETCKRKKLELRKTELIYIELRKGL